MIKAVVFDLDGTLVDSLGDIGQALNHALQEYGLAPKSQEWVRAHVGLGAAHLIAGALGFDESSPAFAGIMESFGDYYNSHPADTTTPFEGVPECLAELEAAGKTLAVLSNKPTDVTLKVVDILGWRPLFAFVWGGDSFPEKKPSPLALLHLMSECGLSPGEVLMVGDSSADVRCAAAAGAVSAWFSGGYGTLETGSSPGFAFGRMGELCPFVLGREQLKGSPGCGILPAGSENVGAPPEQLGLVPAGAGDGLFSGMS